MTIESNRTLGGVGACLTLTGVVTTIVSIIQAGNTSSNIGLLGLSSIIGGMTFIGFILFLVSMYGLSKDYGEPRIFRYILYGIIGTIVSAVVIVIVWFTLTMVNILSIITSTSTLPTSSSEIQAVLLPYYAPIIPVFSVVMLFWIYFNYKSYNLLADNSGIVLFKNAAKIFVLGAIVNVVAGVIFAVLAYTGQMEFTTLRLASAPGGFIQYVAWAVMAKGLFAIKAPSPQTVMPQANPAISGARFCPSCSTENQSDAIFCVKCGKKL